MALREINVEWKHIKSYKTLKGLQRAIESEQATWSEHDDRFIVTQTPEGRWTAIVILDRSPGGYVGRYNFLKV